MILPHSVAFNVWETILDAFALFYAVVIPMQIGEHENMSEVETDRGIEQALRSVCQWGWPLPPRWCLRWMFSCR
jgi:hypothetical protein